MIAKASRGQDLTEEAYWDLLNRKSLSRYFLLAALFKRPMHGYEIAREIGECCGNGGPTDGMIYPTLKELLKGGYISCDDQAHAGRRRKVCTLTPKGAEAYQAGAMVWARLLPHLGETVESARSAGAGKAE